MKSTHSISTGLKAVVMSCTVAALCGCSTAQLPGLASLQRLASNEAEASVPESPAAEAEPAEPSPVAEEEPKPSQLYDWQGNGRNVSRVVINIDEQKARFYSGEQQIGWSTVATGVRAFPTPTGRFEVLEKVADKRSNLYGRIYNAAGRVVKRDARMGRDAVPPGGRFVGAKMPYFMRLTYDGVGLHAGSIPRPGEPASHGCIRLPQDVAPLLYASVSRGTPMQIVGSGPSYGDYAAKVRIAAQQRAAEEARRAQTSRAEPSTPPEAEQTTAVASRSSPSDVEISEPERTEPAEVASTPAAPEPDSPNSTVGPIPGAVAAPAPTAVDTPLPDAEAPPVESIAGSDPNAPAEDEAAVPDTALPAESSLPEAAMTSTEPASQPQPSEITPVEPEPPTSPDAAERYGP